MLLTEEELIRIFMDSNHVILSAVQPETVAARFGNEAQEDEE